jgi:Family of unknown function (DUF6687)
VTTNFYIVGSRTQRPEAGRVIFCDGGVDDTFREETDIELSHWIPNRTPEPFKGDTSTDTSFRFVAAGGLDGGFDLAVNNHVDVDGVLSMFVLLAGEGVLQHRRTIAQAAEMGDFWGWGDRPAQELFQALSLLMQRLAAANEDLQDIYARCFERAGAVLAGGRDPESAEGLDALADSIALIDTEQVSRTVDHARFVHYAVPRAVAERDLDAALHTPRINAPLSRRSMLLPHARSRLDRERVQLVSVETETGWHYDLCYPGYAWADTPHSWRAPGLASLGTSNSHALDYPPLDDAVSDLARRETARGEWTTARQLSPFSSLSGRAFPVVVSFMAEGVPEPSALPPPLVRECLARAFRV